MVPECATFHICLTHNNLPVHIFRFFSDKVLANWTTTTFAVKNSTFDLRIKKFDYECSRDCSVLNVGTQFS
ncbi:hypothetical protein TUM4641_17840 [Shewanella morhuae]|uniref:Uncharacterized protein n=1 Tax=Shewanella morhuae TaxID=365591 RepID=A0A379ZMD5_9GAMM|nr:hypothetical protein TUM4641_17840 [Shewanella morhuae]SUI64576.1 Uncharacterised protein [Shewanella morhuae]